MYIHGAQNVVIVYYYIFGAKGSFVEHNRTTTTSIVCYSLCACVCVSGLFLLLRRRLLLLHLIFFFFSLSHSLSLSRLRPIKETTSASWQRSSAIVKINNIFLSAYANPILSSFFLFFSSLSLCSRFENLMHLLFFFLLTYICFAKQHTHTQITSFDLSLVCVRARVFFLSYIAAKERRRRKKNAR